MSSPNRPPRSGQRVLIRRILAVLPVLPVLLCLAGPAAAISGDKAVMQGLDKVTARISTFEAPLDEEVAFGTLRITLRACERTPPEEPPESSAFLDIREVKQGEPPVSVFRGWMFASSPALSALEHPVYDVWVVECVVDSAAGGESE